MNHIPLSQLIIGFLLGVGISLAARKARTLDKSGMIAAAVTGGAVFAFGGLAWALVLLTFFVSSSMLSKLFRAKKEIMSEKFAKSSQRDWGQVLANGALGAFFAVLGVFFGHSALPWLGFLGAMATVNADTWSTEIGVLNPTPPRLITSFQAVEAGTSGGVSQLGLLATVMGAFLIGAVGGLFNSTLPFLQLVLVSVVAGLAGSLFDSLLGATLQAIYFCPVCAKETERHPLHGCGTPTRQIRGVSWMNNDIVNFLASLLGAAVAIGLGAWLMKLP